MTSATLCIRRYYRSVTRMGGGVRPGAARACGTRLRAVPVMSEIKLVTTALIYHRASTAADDRRVAIDPRVRTDRNARYHTTNKQNDQFDRSANND
jgi:hypothetical protein